MTYPSHFYRRRKGQQMLVLLPPRKTREQWEKLELVGIWCLTKKKTWDWSPCKRTRCQVFTRCDFGRDKKKISRKLQPALSSPSTNSPMSLLPHNFSWPCKTRSPRRWDRWCKNWCLFHCRNHTKLCRTSMQTKWRVWGWRRHGWVVFFLCHQDKAIHFVPKHQYLKLSVSLVTACQCSSYPLFCLTSHLIKKHVCSVCLLIITQSVQLCSQRGESSSFFFLDSRPNIRE